MNNSTAVWRHNITEENSRAYSLNQMQWMPSARAHGQ